ncbi:M24 family metallopeptidase [Streptomyces sp. NPDC090085]|uniref:M24 family metallopeptidase n=1 Tax=Streptomyces sp. NPDC090085 TaxID=3365943 RepID=UPI0037F356BF
MPAAGRSEFEATDRIGDLARELWGTRVQWPGRIVRSGPHTVRPGSEEPPGARVLGPGDTVTVRLGPLLGGHGADFTRTVVLGDDPAGIRLRLHEDLPALFAAGRGVFHRDAGITGRELYAALGGLVGKAGWSLVGPHAGRLAGGTPSADPCCTRPESLIGPDNELPLRRPTPDGRQAHWSLELHLVDARSTFGGSHADLLDLP